MDISRYLIPDPDEKPLDVIKDDGGFTSVFRKIAVIGDSLASGDLESMDLGGPREYHDYFDISWGQYLARACGSTVYNFTRGNMTVREYCDSFASAMGYWDRKLAAQAYVIALGVNDLDPDDSIVGSLADVDPDYHFNKPTFAGYFARIIQHYKEIQPDAVFFLLTIPEEPEGTLREEVRDRYRAQGALMRDFAAFFTNTYVIDLEKYGPVQDAEFRRLFYTGGHLNSAGYYLMSKLIGSYIDYVIRHNLEKFNQAGLIGTPYKYCEQPVKTD